MMNALVWMKVELEQCSPLIALASLELPTDLVELPIAIVNLGHTIRFVVSNRALDEHIDQFIDRRFFQARLEVIVVAPPLDLAVRANIWACNTAALGRS
jgi:hypothetical protein